MRNQSVSDFVAKTMDNVLNSKEHQSLFGIPYKVAQDLNDARKKKAPEEKKDSSSDENDARKKHKDSEEDKDSCMADDNDARKKKNSEERDSSAASDDNDAKGGKKCEECGKPKNFCKCDKSSADDVGASKPVVSNDGKSVVFTDPAHIHGDVHHADLEPSIAYDVAVDSLLTASAALDSVGLGRSSALTLKIASIVVEAKKKEKDSKKSKKDSKKSSKDSQSAKDKKFDKKDSKKDDKKDSKKSK